MDRIQLDIVTPDRRVLSREVDEVTLSGQNGALGVLPGHTELLTLLQPGALELRDGNETLLYSVAGGVAEVTHHKVVVLADAAESAAEIDVARAEAAKTRAESELEAVEMSDEHYAGAHAALGRAAVRLNIAGMVRDRR